MTDFESPVAIALFGSVARGDSDHLSDKDVLIVVDDFQLKTSIDASFRTIGYSPTCYSWKRLESAVAAKRLFVQHLRQDARVVYDPSNRLRDVLTGFRPKADYADELKTAEELLLVPLSIPDCIQGYHWSFDLLAIAVRNVGIVRLAQEGEYRFSFRSILEGLVRIGALMPSDVVTLARVREYKRRFRARMYHPALPFRTIERIANLVSKRFELDVAARRLSAERTLIAAVASDEPDAWYPQLRRLEAAMFALPADRNDEELEFLRTEVNRLARSPADYGWIFKRASGQITRRIGGMASSRILGSW